MAQKESNGVYDINLLFKDVSDDILTTFLEGKLNLKEYAKSELSNRGRPFIKKAKKDGTNRNLDAFLQASNEFLAICDNIYGLYLDSTQGYNSIFDGILQDQKNDHLKTDAYTYVYASPDGFDRNSYVLHKSTLGKVKNRNSINGENYLSLAAYAIVLIFEHWEREYREKISVAVDQDRELIQFDVLGSMRLFRNDILHNNRIITDKTAKDLKSFDVKAGNSINITFYDLSNLITRIKESLTVYCIKVFDHDPDFEITEYIPERE